MRQDTLPACRTGAIPLLLLTIPTSVSPDRWGRGTVSDTVLQYGVIEVQHADRLAIARILDQCGESFAPRCPHYGVVVFNQVRDILSVDDLLARCQVKPQQKICEPHPMQLAARTTDRKSVV